VTRILRRRTLERRLFGWLLALTLVPPLAVLGAAGWISRGTLDWFGTLGPWAAVSESGRQLIDAAEGSAASDPELARAVRRHRDELSSSLVQAQRWAFLGQRLTSLLPFVYVLLAIVLAVIALLVTRKLARDLARPFLELATWAEQLAREEPLPAPQPRERREVREVQMLRQSLRRAAEDLTTARRKALQAERTRAWGEMARRIAHEMKNPLTPLRLAAHRLRSGADIGEAATVIQEETERLDQLAKQFALLGRPAAENPTAIDVVELLESLVRTDVPPDIEARVSSVPSREALPLVTADYNAILQAFRNILRNAVEAVRSTEPPHTIDVGVHLEDGFVAVAIADSGPGLRTDALHLVFEPDFTGKPGGTGLGLAVARRAIETHGGTIEARSSERAGAVFVVRLPRRADNPQGGEA